MKNGWLKRTVPTFFAAMSLAAGGAYTAARMKELLTTRETPEEAR